MTREMPSARLAEELQHEPEAGPFNTSLWIGYVPVSGRIEYHMDPEWITLGPSRVATPKTYVEFQGQTAYGQRSRIPFHVTSLDWQESDRVLAGIMTTFGSADRRDSDWRLRRVRRRDARGLLAAADRRRVLR